MKLVSSSKVYDTYTGVVRILLAILFLIISTWRFINLEYCETAIYYLSSSLDISYWFSHLLIGLGLMLAFGLLSNMYHRLYRCIILVLGVFIVCIYLYAHLDLLPRAEAYLRQDVIRFIINPLWYNILVLILALSMSIHQPSFALLNFGQERSNRKLHTYLSILFLFLPIALMPSTWIYKDNPNKEHQVERIEKFINSSGSSINFSEYPINKGKKLLCFLTTSYHYNIMTMGRISYISDVYSIPDSNVMNIFCGDSSLLERFYISPSIKEFKHFFIHPRIFYNITESETALVMLVNNGKVESLYGRHNINLKEIEQFFK